MLGSRNTCLIESPLEVSVNLSCGNCHMQLLESSYVVVQRTLTSQLVAVAHKEEEVQQLGKSKVLKLILPVRELLCLTIP